MRNRVYQNGKYVVVHPSKAFTTTLLGWGVIDYKAEYEHSGEYINALNMIRWPLEFFIRAHTGQFTTEKITQNSLLVLFYTI